MWSPTAASETPSVARSAAVFEPTLPKPCTMSFLPSRRKRERRAHSQMQCTSPCPVAFSRPKVPPLETGLPVTTPMASSFFTMPTVFM